MSTQKPIGSGFGPATTAQEAIGQTDLTGKIAIVTGGYSGLGLETTRVLAAAGAHVVVPVRTPEKASAALAGIAGVETDSLDLTDPTSIDAFAARFIASGRPLHILVNSAGIMATPLERDARGHESQFATNHLGHFQLTARLWPALVAAKGARVVSVSSRGHHIAPVDFDDIDFERRPYDKWQAYGQSKTANALFAVGLDARGATAGIRAFSVHPGSILSDLARHLTDEEIKAFNVYDDNGNRVVDPARGIKTVEQGAATAVWCATSPQLDGLGGLYCEDCEVSILTPADSAVRLGVKAWAVDPQASERLWQLSEKLTGATRG
ncbi:MAG TPA: oxidoreductase [Devosiaceae bacterium]|jgi:NAD(P)-dependent dehydrogenase (short-subunit alcohol dehydrogenase family)